MTWGRHYGKFVDNETDVTLVNNTTKTQTFTVPTGKRWAIMSTYQQNGDNVDRSCNIRVYDSSGVYVLGELQPSVSIAAGSNTYRPKKDVATGIDFFPIIAESGEKIIFSWAAGGASAGGSSRIYLRVLEMITD